MHALFDAQYQASRAQMEVPLALRRDRLRRLRRHFDHSVWLNTIPAADWEHAYGSVTIRKVREVFPMFELTVDGLTAATRKLMVRY